MYKYFEYGDFLKEEYVDWQKLYNYLENMPFDEDTTQRNDERYSS